MFPVQRPFCHNTKLSFANVMKCGFVVDKGIELADRGSNLIVRVK